MEANEMHELHEQHEHATHEPSLRPISFTMSVLAVLVAIVTVLSHRTHTQSVLQQARASDQWNLYQAKKIRQNNTTLSSDLLGVIATHDPSAAAKLNESYKAHVEKWNEDLSEEQETAHKFEEAVERAERRANRYDLGEALLEIALVVTSITLLTRSRPYWYLGGVFGVLGIIAVITGLLLR